MKILLINPPFQRFKSISLGKMNLSLGYVATQVAEMGYDVKIYDGELPNKDEPLRPTTNIAFLDSHHLYTKALTGEHPVWNEIAEVIKSFQPNVVGITLTTPTYGSARKLNKIVRNVVPQSTIVWGGVHPTLMPDDVLIKEKEIDYVVRGEGEITFKELIEFLMGDLKNVKDIAGISYHKNNEIIHNPGRDFIKNLDEIPFPRRDLFINPVSDPSIYSVITGSRGCPYDCAYCSSKFFWHRKTRFRSPENIIAEIKELKNIYHTNDLDFFDDSFTLKKSWVLELCDLLIKEKLNISYWCNTRADLLNDEMCVALKKSGCTAVNIGVESGSENTLSYLNRKLTKDDIIKASILLEKYKIDWYAYYMFGFPKETKEDINETLKFMSSLTASWQTLSIFNPYPKTQLYDLCDELKLLPKNLDWSQFSHQSPENHFVSTIEKDEFRNIIREIAKKFDNHNNSPFKKLKRLWKKRDYYLLHPSKIITKILSNLKPKMKST